MNTIFTRLFGSSDREIKRLKPIVEAVNALKDEYQAMSDDALRAKTAEFKARLAAGETLDDVLPEAFATVREAAKRTIGEYHYDVQLLGGIVLHSGRIAQMKTGEGKTLTSTLPIYLNALAGKGVHVVTVNDYLARRDAAWMGQVYHFLGLSVGCILQQGLSYRYVDNVPSDGVESTVEQENLVACERQEAYGADITYGTNNEYGFDYLRDNMVPSPDKMVQRGHAYAIVDEVDSILIDEARTPLIISTADTESTELYQRFASVVPKLAPETHYSVDVKMKSVYLTDEGITYLEKLLGVDDIYASHNIQYVHHLEQSLKAEVIFERDRDYVVQGGEVLIVDDFTGRLMPGRRYSDGLHQALEAKEHVPVQRESRTLATITFQNYFRMYGKLAGMTGTADTSAEEFSKVYNLDVVSIPTHRDNIRQDLSDIIYRSAEGKYRAITERVKEIHAQGQPVLIGTIAIEKSEELSGYLLRAGIKHEVLNAKNHEREAQIIADAGKHSAVTIATNMAGRGTDIKLGAGVAALGGLYIIGTERHEARRIDDQLRGRAGRQGDPGTTQFYISLDDELIRRFGGEKMKGLLTRLGLPDDEPIQNSLISKSVENAQSRIEGFNFDSRKHVLEYDDVVNKQRETLYGKRRLWLATDDITPETKRLLALEVDQLVRFQILSLGRPQDDGSDGIVAGILPSLQHLCPHVDTSALQPKLEALAADQSLDANERIEQIIAACVESIQTVLADKAAKVGSSFPQVQKSILLASLDNHWMNHLDSIEYLRQGIGLRGYGQKDPLVEFRKEAYELFIHLMDSVRRSYFQALFGLNTDNLPTNMAPQDHLAGAEFHGATEGESTLAPEPKSTAPLAPVVKGDIVERNAPCPCGSGKKYKKCHGA